MQVCRELELIVPEWPGPLIALNSDHSTGFHTQLPKIVVDDELLVNKLIWKEKEEPSAKSEIKSEKNEDIKPPVDSLCNGSSAGKEWDSEQPAPINSTNSSVDAAKSEPQPVLSPEDGKFYPSEQPSVSDTDGALVNQPDVCDQSLDLSLHKRPRLET